MAWLPKGSNLSTKLPVGAYRFRSAAGHSLKVYMAHEVGERTSLNLFVPHIRQPGTFALDQQANLILGNRNPGYGVFNRYASLANATISPARTQRARSLSRASTR